MENETDHDEIEFVSKSQLKRDSHAMQDLGKRLVALPADHLARIPLDEALLDAIALQADPVVTGQPVQSPLYLLGQAPGPHEGPRGRRKSYGLTRKGRTYAARQREAWAEFMERFSRVVAL